MEISETKRYGRQIILPEIGQSGQERILKSKILCIGAGGLGCPALLYLASAGVGNIGIIDNDVVDESNLQRQILFKTKDVGQKKVAVAAACLKELNPKITVATYPVRLSSENASQLFKDYDLIIDGSDNFPTKYLVNDTAVLEGMPFVFGSVSKFEGRVAVFNANSGPCYRCLYPYPPEGHIPNCAESGVLGALTGIIGSMQAMEALKFLINAPALKSLSGKLLLLDSSTMNVDSINVNKNPNCPICSDNPKIKEIIEYKQTCCAAEEISSHELKQAIYTGKITLVDVRDDQEWNEGHIEGAVHIPLSKLQSNENVGFFNSRQCILYCRSGNRSERALMALKAKGITGNRHLKGGILSWNDDLETGKKQDSESC